MFECLILGDSLAVGISQHRPDCAVQAAIGLSSKKFNQGHSGPFNARAVIISLGSNDSNYPILHEELVRLRKKIRSHIVYWVVPVKAEAAATVLSVASSFNDRVLKPQRISRDRVHPTSEGYKLLADAATPS